MTEKTEPDLPGAVRKHSLHRRMSGSLRTRMASARSRVRRSHLIVAGGVVLALAAGGVAWAAIGSVSGSPEAAGSDPAPGPDTTAPADATSTGPSTPDPEATGPESGPPTGSPEAGFPVPTWEPGPGPGGRDGNPWRGNRDDDRRRGDRNEPPPGMPSDLQAERDGDTVVLRWTDNTTNEDGFAIFVTQGRTTFQVVVPAGTTSYEGVTAARDTRTCFTVIPFTWTAPVPTYPIGEWECTDRRRP